MTLEQVVREEWGRLTSLLLGQFRRLDLVEDALADAVEAAATAGLRLAEVRLLSKLRSNSQENAAAVRAP